MNGHPYIPLRVKEMIFPLVILTPIPVNPRSNRHTTALRKPHIVKILAGYFHLVTAVIMGILKVALLSL